MKDLDPEIKAEIESMGDMTDAERKEIIEAIQLSKQSSIEDHRRNSDTQSLENTELQKAIKESKSQYVVDVIDKPKTKSQEFNVV